MEYSEFFRRTLNAQGFDLVAQYNCFDPPYDPESGWPLKLPDVEFGPDTLVLLHFQDFVTHRHGCIIELDRVEKFYRDRSHQVLITHWPHRLEQYYQGPLNLAEFNGHEYAILANLKSRLDEWQREFDIERTHAWQCLNGRKCSHRLRAAQILESWPGGMLSYGSGVPLPQWPYSSYRGTSNEDNFIRLAPIYAKCAVNIVTETQYDPPLGLITEKTIFALLASQVPIVIGYRGIVQDCIDLGFDMFTDLVDVSYDREANSQRVEQAIWSNQRLIMGEIDLAPFRCRLESQRQFLLEYYCGLLETRFMMRVESLRRDWS